MASATKLFAGTLLVIAKFMRYFSQVIGSTGNKTSGAFSARIQRLDVLHQKIKFRILYPTQKTPTHTEVKSKKPTIAAKLAAFRASLPDRKTAFTNQFYTRRNMATFTYQKKIGELNYALKNRYFVTRNKLSAQFSTIVRKIPPNDYLAFIRRHNYGFDKMIYESKPDIIMLLENNIETTTHLLTKRLVNSGIKTVVLPFTIPNPNEAAHFYKNKADRKVNGIISKIVAKTFPKWTYEYQGQKMLRLAPSKILTVEALGLTTPQPWIPNSGHIDRVLIESEAMKQLYQGLGFPATKLALIGDALDEQIQNRRRRKEKLSATLIKSFNFSSEKPLLLCAFPPDQYGDDASGFEFSSYNNMIKEWIRMFIELSAGFNIIVRPHPRVKPELLAKYCNNNVVLSSAPTHELVPLCDIYLACISATIRWALACGIPVINYDTYRYRYDDFKDSSVVYDVETKEACQEQLIAMGSNTAFLNEISKLADEEKYHWGIQSTKFAPNLAKVVKEVVA